MKPYNDTVWNRNSDLPICSTAPEPLCYRGPLPCELYRYFCMLLTFGFSPRNFTQEPNVKFHGTALVIADGRARGHEARFATSEVSTV